LNTAIAQAQGKGGGKVCLGPGLYNITEAVKVGGPNAIEISGHGLPRLVAGTGLSNSIPIMQIEGAVNVMVGDLAFVGPAPTPNQPSIPGIVVGNSSFVRINRCLFTGPTHIIGAAPGVSQDTLSPAIGIAGFVWGAAIRDNVFDTVKVGVGFAPAGSQQMPTFLGYSSMRDNEMECTSAGVLFTDPKIDGGSFLEVVFADNAVASPIGFQLSGHGLDIAVERNSFVVNSNSTFSPSPVNAAIVCSANQARIIHNQISGDGKNPGRDGIILDGKTIHGTHIAGNHINNLSGLGILATAGTVLADTIISQNQLLNLGGSGMVLVNGSRAIDLHITGNLIANVGLARGATADLAGIELTGTVLNLNVSENVIEHVGSGNTASSARFGIRLNRGSAVRIEGNRIVDIGPPGAVTLSAGILLLVLTGRVDISDNEVRRASVTPSNSADASPSGALLVGLVGGDVNIRGNLLESFGSLSTVVLLLARSCIFANNQCFLDNAAASNLTKLAVLLGANPTAAAGAIAASSNFVQVPIPPNASGAPPVVVSLNPGNATNALTVLGNITSGRIQVDGAPLAAPWLPLNVINL
jgi:hypothetical protein